MLLGGDERGRTQGGNNNAWCQDNETSWFDWELDDAQAELLEFTRRLLELRRSHPVFRRTEFLDGGPAESALPDAWWFRPDGRQMAQRDWQNPDMRELGVFLNGEETGIVDARGEPVDDDSFVVLLNATPEAVVFRLPPRRFGLEWELELSTADPEAEASAYPGRVGRRGAGALAHAPQTRSLGTRPRAPGSLHVAGDRGMGPLASAEAVAVRAPDAKRDDELLVRRRRGRLVREAPRSMCDPGADV